MATSSPDTYTMYNYLMTRGVETKAVLPTIDIHMLAIVYFVAITLVNYVLYLTKKEKV